MRLATFTRRYIAERDVCREYAHALTNLAGDFSAWLRRQADTRDFRDATVNRWLADLCSANGRSKTTLANKRRQLLTLWRAAWMDGKVREPPKRVRVIETPPPQPTAWSKSDVKRLLAAAGREPGIMRCGVKRRDFWRAFVLVGYYSGLRLGDICRLRADQINSSGMVLVRQHKTGAMVLCRLRRDALESLRRIASPKRERIIGGCLCRRRIMKQFRGVVASAGLNGGTKMLRRTGATLVELGTPGAAMAFLGHKTPGLAYRHYVDATAVQRHKPTPPRIH